MPNSRVHIETRRFLVFSLDCEKECFDVTVLFFYRKKSVGDSGKTTDSRKKDADKECFYKIDGLFLI